MRIKAFFSLDDCKVMPDHFCAEQLKAPIMAQRAPVYLIQCGLAAGGRPLKQLARFITELSCAWLVSCTFRTRTCSRITASCPGRHNNYL